MKKVNDHNQPAITAFFTIFLSNPHAEMLIFPLSTPSIGWKKIELPRNSVGGQK
jgi:hypothetical protein